MSDIAERYARIAGIFSERVHAVPPEAWDNPSPCEDWTARDVVGHLTGWILPFFSSQGVEFPPVPSVEDDPVGAWDVVQAVLANALPNPDIAARQLETPFGPQSFAETVDTLVIAELFTHGWDLSRATGQSDVFDPEQLQRMISGMGTLPEEVMRAPGMFGPPIDVEDDVDDQTRFLAYVGRRA
jgi:uncharacterized protein (TIGR03086 family)